MARALGLPGGFTLPLVALVDRPLFVLLASLSRGQYPSPTLSLEPDGYIDVSCENPPGTRRALEETIMEGRSEAKGTYLLFARQLIDRGKPNLSPRS